MIVARIVPRDHYVVVTPYNSPQGTVRLAVRFRLRKLADDRAWQACTVLEGSTPSRTTSGTPKLFVQATLPTSYVMTGFKYSKGYASLGWDALYRAPV